MVSAMILADREHGSSPLLSETSPVIGPGYGKMVDLPHAKDYVEECTIEKQQGPTDECRFCGVSFQGREQCTGLGSDGYQHRSSTYGASVWQEIWCRPKASRSTLLEHRFDGLREVIDTIPAFRVHGDQSPATRYAYGLYQPVFVGSLSLREPVVTDKD